MGVSQKPFTKNYLIKKTLNIKWSFTMNKNASKQPASNKSEPTQFESAKPSRIQYAQILASLTHPIRRQILRILNINKQTFTQLKSTLNISSPLLSYHLGQIATMLSHKGEHYHLSPLGKQAANLQDTIEYNTNPQGGNTMEFTTNEKTLAKLSQEVIVKMVESQYLIYLFATTIGLAILGGFILIGTDLIILGMYALMGYSRLTWTLNMIILGTPLIITQIPQLKNKLQDLTTLQKYTITIITTAIILSIAAALMAPLEGPHILYYPGVNGTTWSWPPTPQMLIDPSFLWNIWFQWYNLIYPFLMAIGIGTAFLQKITNMVTGKALRDVSFKLKISPRTVKQIINNIINKET
jgi:DNA-binding CsgD family transcriptional regulator